jgi:acetyl esterase/lipase
MRNVAFRSLVCGAIALMILGPRAWCAEESVTYKRVGDRELKLLIDKPAAWKTGAGLPAVVYYFGGGWVGGRPGQFMPQSEYLATRGVVGIRVEYRVIPKGDSGPPTICVNDAKSAMRYVRGHAKELGVDPKRIAAAGGSAGGHLAAATALLPGLDDPADDVAVSARPDALILFNPVMNNGPGEWGNARVGERFKEFSPAHNVKAGAPPTIVFLGDKDRLIPVKVVRDFEAAMKAANARCDVRIYPGAGHGFFNKRKEDGRWFTETLVEADRFLASLGWVSGEPTLKVEAEGPAGKPAR